MPKSAKVPVTEPFVLGNVGQIRNVSQMTSDYCFASFELIFGMQHAYTQTNTLRQIRSDKYAHVRMTLYSYNLHQFTI